MTEVRKPFDRFRRGPVDQANVQPTGTPPATVAGGLGVVRGAKADVPMAQPPKGRQMTPKDAERLMQAELLSAVHSLLTSSTELSAKLGRQGASNGVLDVFLATVGADGCLSRDYPVTVGCIRVVNHHLTLPATVQSGPPAGSSAPTRGTGVNLIEPLSSLVVPIGTRAFTLWAPADTQLSVQAYTGLQALGVGTL